MTTEEGITPDKDEDVEVPSEEVEGHMKLRGSTDEATDGDAAARRMVRRGPDDDEDVEGHMRRRV
jgi:hypothetical protein